MALNYVVLNFSFTVLEPIQLNKLFSNTIRGALGINLKRHVCIFSIKKDCRECIIRYGCAYAYLFETYIPPTIKKLFDRGEVPPHPYLIEYPVEEVQEIYQPGSNLEFNLILFGKAIDFLSYIIYTFEKVGEQGIGKKRGKYVINAISIASSKGSIPIYDKDNKILKTDFPIETLYWNHWDKAVNQLIVKFETPTELRTNKRISRDPNFYDFLVPLIRRLKILNALYGNGQDLVIEDTLIEEAKQIQTIDKKLYWKKYSRFSERQKRLIKLSGFKGEIEFKGNLTPFMPFIIGGKITHVGKHTSFGFGKYEIITKG